MSDYDDLIKKKFVQGLETQSKSNPHTYWLKNASNAKRSTPDLAGWMTKHKSLEAIFVSGLPAVKATLLDLALNGVGVTDASAMTLILVRYNLVEDKKTKEVRTALLGTSSLNQKVGGQVHAEHITTDTLVSLILDKGKSLQTQLMADTSSKATGTLELAGPVEVFVYPSEPGPKSGGFKSVSDFKPCKSCVETVSASLKRLGKPVKLFGVTGDIKVT